MDLQNHGRFGRDGALVVAQMRTVGGADLDEFGARGRHDVGDAEAAANLDKLAAADDNLFARGMSRQHQQHRGGVVVDHERVLGTGE